MPPGPVRRFFCVVRFDDSSRRVVVVVVVVVLPPAVVRVVFSSRLSRTDARYAPERFFGLKLESFLRAYPPADGLVVWGAGPIGKAWARGLADRGRAVRAFVEVDPRKIGQTIHGAPVVAVEAAGVYRRELHLAAVGLPDDRRRIREAAAGLGIERLVAVA